MEKKISGYVIGGFILSLLFFVIGLFVLLKSVNFSIPDTIIIFSIFTILGILSLAFDIVGLIDITRNQLTGKILSILGIILSIIPIFIIIMGMLYAYRR